MIRYKERGLSQHYDRRAITVMQWTYRIFTLLICDCNQLLITQYQVATVRSPVGLQDWIAVLVFFGANVASIYGGFYS